MLEFRPNLVFVVINFNYHSKAQVGETGQRGHKGIPNEIRRAFLGLKRGSPNIPKELRAELSSGDKDTFYPVNFSLIKKPIKIQLTNGKHKLRNTAVGAVIHYEHFGLIQDLVANLKVLNNYLKKLFTAGTKNYSSSVGEYQIVIGKIWKEIKE